VMQKLGEWWTALSGYVSKQMPGWIAILEGWATAAWKWLADVTPKVLSTLGEWWTTISGYIGKKLPGWVTVLGGWATAAWKWLSDVMPTVLSTLADWGGALWDWVKQQAPTWFDHLREWGKIAWEWIVEVTPKVLSTLGEWGAALWGWVKDNAPTWGEALLEWAGIAWEWIRDVAIPKAIEQLGTWLTQMKDWITENWPTWKDKMVTAGTDFLKWLQDGMEIGWIQLHKWFFSDTAFGRFVGDMLQLFGVQMGPAYGVFYDHGKEIAYSLNEGSRFGMSSLTQTGWDMGSALSGGLEDQMIMHSPSRRMFGYGADIVEGLAQGITAGVERTRDAMNGAASAIIDVAGHCHRLEK
jgi:hypothetical protein